MNGAPSCMPMSKTAQMFGWLSAAAARASCSKRASRSGSADSARRQDFDRDVAFEPRVAGLVDLAHAARAEERIDAIGPEDGAGRQRGLMG